ncbi:ribosome biogenesis GTPase YlqF [Pectinatus haikarae]|uniref:Ribosome biogenesis GTPase A n=1 Tax=Pectinatus haikarae TaxID=349096 RepID=A0ABT9Y8N3_9FIRM|nr:ribosome biogenesis GTPase YlqF [Pectinatus haikarae]MDQ0204200.1 ribosome biogenesis GTPase A [Pectinatus haikarae]
MEEQKPDIPLVQWFPGHMTKARRLIEENLKLVDIVVELLDARIPLSSSNPMLAGMISGKTHAIVLNKADLADPAITREWITFYKRMGKSAMAVDSVQGKNIKELTNMINDLTQRQTAKFAAKGARPRNARAMIVGIPNVGKSSLINRLAGTVAAKTENRPGVTRAKQWIRIGKHIDLLDMPGLLWPKFDDPAVGINLAFTGAVNDDIYDKEKVALLLLEYMQNYYPHFLMTRYKIDVLPDSTEELFEVIGKKRGCLLKGGKLDEEKITTVVFTDFRSGRLGKISLESPSV